MLKGLSNLASLMRQAQEMGGKMQAVQEQLKARRVTGTAGGGLIEVELNGLGEMLRLAIDPALTERGDREMIEDLVPAAVNQAQGKVRQLHAEAMQQATAELDLPGLDAVLSRFQNGPSGG